MPNRDGMDYNIVDMKYAYAAGLFDGDGCVSVSGKSLIVSIGSVDINPLAFIFELFEGNITDYQPKGNRQLTHTWTVYGKNAGTFLRSILPYLITKKSQALLGLALLTVAFDDESNRTPIINEIHRLNKRGIKKEG